MDSWAGQGVDQEKDVAAAAAAAAPAATAVAARQDSVNLTPSLARCAKKRKEHRNNRMLSTCLKTSFSHFN